MAQVVQLFINGEAVYTNQVHDAVDEIEVKIDGKLSFRTCAPRYLREKEELSENRPLYLDTRIPRG